MLVAIGRAFDVEAIDRLLFLCMCEKDFLVVSGDGVLQFARLIAAGLVTVEQKTNNDWYSVTYAANISNKGRLLMEAWQQGNRDSILTALGPPLSDPSNTQSTLLSSLIKA